MNNESNNQNTSTNDVVNGEVGPTVSSIPVVPSSSVGGAPEVGLAEMNLNPVTPQVVDPTNMEDSVPASIPVAPQIVNDPTADFKNSVDGSTISTESTAPRITDTAAEGPAQTQVTLNNSGPSFSEKAKMAQENYKPPSKLKMGLMIFFFIIILAFIIFLPEVTDFVDEMKSGNTQTTVEEITTGKLVCELSSSTTNLDKNYVRTFKYTDNKLQSVVLETTIKGDVTEDEETLDAYNDTCLLIKNNVSSYSGISIDCDYSEGKLIETESFDLNSYDSEEVSAAYTEAGADMVQFELNADIDDIKTSMLQSGFSCEKKSS